MGIMFCLRKHEKKAVKYSISETNASTDIYGSIDNIDALIIQH